MSTYSEIYLVANGKRYSFNDDFDFTCAKTLTTLIEICKFDDYIKQTCFLDSFLGEEREWSRSYIMELDIAKWLATDIEIPEGYEYTVGFIVGVCKVPGHRLFFRNEYCDCLGGYGEDNSDKYRERGWAIEYE